MAKDQHDYRTCRDKHCERFPCRIYREGWADGHDAGIPDGYADGYADGFAAAPAGR